MLFSATEFAVTRYSRDRRLTRPRWEVAALCRRGQPMVTCPGLVAVLLFSALEAEEQE